MTPNKQFTRWLLGSILASLLLLTYVIVQAVDYQRIPPYHNCEGCACNFGRYLVHACPADETDYSKMIIPNDGGTIILPGEKPGTALGGPSKPPESTVRPVP